MIFVRPTIMRKNHHTAAHNHLNEHPLNKHLLAKRNSLRSVIGPMMRLVSLCVLLLLTCSADAATLPNGFAETLVAGNLADPTAMAFAPDGRLFVTQQGGQLRVIKNGQLLATPFLTLSVDATGERGLLGIAFDPNFAANGYVYVYYTVPSPVHNRVSRFTANGDVAVSGSEVVILDLDSLSGATNHNGGALHFGPEGKLYIAVGENAAPLNAQTLANLHGKMLRINADGSVPTDNPFYNSAAGRNRAIWALGLRNPFTFAFQPGTSRMFINDVGQGAWEEINDGIASSNYGWPGTEGYTADSSFRSPLYAYGRSGDGAGSCAITGGTFYNPPTTQFPSEYVGRYFFADFCAGWIRVLDVAGSYTMREFASGISAPVDLKVSTDGSLYLLARGGGGGGGSIYKIQYTASPATEAPRITAQPTDQTVSVNQAATFTIAVTGTAPLAYQWQRNGVSISSATSTSYTVTAAQLADNAARFSCVVSNAAGTATSTLATLSVRANTAPTATITSPAAATLYRGGERFSYAGVGSDQEDGVLPPGAFTWRVDFHHDTHWHPFVPPTAGTPSGSFIIPTVGETAANVWYRITLTVTDSSGAQSAATRDIFPRKVMLTLRSNPAGIPLTLDGQPQPASTAVVSVVGVQRTLGVSASHIINGIPYDFVSWSDGGSGATHNISSPEADTIYTANFRLRSAASSSTVQFTAAVASVSEADRSVVFTVVRNGDDLTGACAVDYSTSDGTGNGTADGTGNLSQAHQATERTDFTPVIGTLRFAPGENSKTFAVLLTNDLFVEGDEVFRVTLSNPTSGAVLGEKNSQAITIQDNDQTPLSTNPLNDPQFFVRHLYLDFLNREPDAAGLEFWAQEITGCAGDRACIETKRVNVSAAFFLSKEFQETGFFAYRFYKASFGRMPRWREFLRDTQELSRNVVVNAPDWQQQLAANKAVFIAEWMDRPDFKAQYDDLSNNRFVDALAAHAQLTFTPQRRDELVNDLNRTGSRIATMGAIIEAEAFVQAEFNRAFVLMQYFGYLRRNPDDAPDSSLAGYNFWLDKLNGFRGNYIAAEMVKSFTESGEFRQRFGQ